MVLIPLLTHVALTLGQWAQIQSHEGREASWRIAALRATVVWGVLLLAITEILGAGHLLTRGWLTLSWVVLLLGVTAWLLTLRRGGAFPAITFSLGHLSDVDRLLLVGVVILVGLIGVAALVTLPQHSDAVSYHMGRVMHWAQNRSVSHYATPDSRQVFMPPWPAYVVLHFHLLSGGDRLANIVQWLSMVGTLLAVSVIVSQLGGGRKAQIYAVVFTATLPFGIAQASDTLTDYAAAYWVVCGTVFALEARQRPETWSPWLYLGGAAALGMQTKGTAPLYALPFVIWPLLTAFRRLSVRRWSARVTTLALIVLSLNAMYWARNWRSFGFPLGPESHMVLLSVQEYALLPTLSNLIKNLALHLATPFDALNATFTDAILALHARLGVDVLDPATTHPMGSIGLRWVWPGTNSAPMHLVLFTLTIGLLWVKARGEAWRFRRLYAVAALAGLMIFSATIKWQGAARFQIPFFASFAPLVGIRLEARAPWSTGRWIAALLLIAALPVVVFDRWRPLIGMRPYTVTESIFKLSPTEVLFAGKPRLRKPYESVADEILGSSCKNVGIRMDSHDPEYLWWWLLQPEDNEIQIEHDLVFPGLEAYSRKDFQPCALICVICDPKHLTRDGLTATQVWDEVILYRDVPVPP